MLRYGNARDWCSAWRWCCPTGRSGTGCARLRKDNTGYDLKQLFIGAEGTLGIITAAVLKLFPRPREIETALVALAGVEDAMQLLFARARGASGDQLTAFELIPRSASRSSPASPADATRSPSRIRWYVLLELSSSRAPAA